MKSAAPRGGGLESTVGGRRRPPSGLIKEEGTEEAKKRIREEKNSSRAPSWGEGPGRLWATRKKGKVSFGGLANGFRTRA